MYSDSRFNKGNCELEHYQLVRRELGSLNATMELQNRMTNGLNTFGKEKELEREQKKRCRGGQASWLNEVKKWE